MTAKSWQFGYWELRKILTPSNKKELDFARPLLNELYGMDYKEPCDPWGISRAIIYGDELPRVPFVDLSRRHREKILAAIIALCPVPENAVKQYSDLHLVWKFKSINIGKR